MLSYANVSKGYKSGSIPAVNSSTSAQIEPVTQESVLAYEVGFKSTLLDDRMRLNGAAFYYDYEDKQLRGRILDFVLAPLKPWSIFRSRKFMAPRLAWIWCLWRG